MSIFVNTNVQSLFAQRALGKNTFNLQKSIEKLSTGYRINRAGDDAAGLSISEKLTAQVRGLQKAKQNVGDGISAIQTAEGGLAIVQDNLQRIRELIVQGLNGTNGTKEYNAIQREINERVSTIGSVAKETKFNGVDLIYDNDAAGDNISIQSGADNSQTTTITFLVGSSATTTAAAKTANTGIDIDITKEIDDTSANSKATTQWGYLTEGLNATTYDGFALDELRIANATITAQDGAGTTALDLDSMDTIINNVSRMRSYLGAMQNSLESKAEYLDVAIENNSSSRSRIRDVDVASESSVMLRNQILQQSAASMLTQANATPQLALNLLP